MCSSLRTKCPVPHDAPASHSGARAAETTHACAAERVAFAYGRRGVTRDGEVIVLSEIVDVEDADYDDDPFAGPETGASPRWPTTWT